VTNELDRAEAQATFPRRVTVIERVTARTVARVTRVSTVWINVMSDWPDRWLDLPLAVIDVETTGLDPEEDRIIEIGIVHFESGEVTDVYGQLIDPDMPLPEEVTELTGITGVGTWTANMQLLFALGREDVFPVGDLGIRKGMYALFGDCSRAEMTGIAERWAPYRSYATLYLWRVGEDAPAGTDEVTTG